MKDSTITAKEKYELGLMRAKNLEDKARFEEEFLEKHGTSANLA